MGKVMKINVQDVKKLREKTQSGYMDCKKALVEANGNIERAQEILREKGFKIMESTSSKTEQGVICSYVHPGDRIGVLLEMKCKTDFVAKTDEFKHFAREMAMQVASMKPDYVSRADVPLDVVSKEVGFRTERLARDGIAYEDEFFQVKLDGEMAQWYSEVCLLEQPYIRDNKKAVKTLLAELVAKVDEPCRVARFDRWEIEAEQVAKEEEFEPIMLDANGSRFRFVGSLILLLLLAALIVGFVGMC